MISCIIYSYLNFILYPHHTNIQLIIKNQSNYNSRSTINNTYTRKNNPNEYGNLVASLPLTRSAYINKGIKPIGNRVSSSTMIIDKVTDYVAFRNAVDYITWAYIAIAIFGRSPPPPPPSYPDMIPIMVTENRLLFWNKHPIGSIVLCTVMNGIIGSIFLVALI